MRGFLSWGKCGKLFPFEKRNGTSLSSSLVRREQAAAHEAEDGFPQPRLRDPHAVRAGPGRAGRADVVGVDPALAGRRPRTATEATFEYGMALGSYALNVRIGDSPVQVIWLEGAQTSPPMPAPTTIAS